MIWTTSFKIRKSKISIYPEYYIIEIWFFIIIPVFIRID